MCGAAAMTAKSLDFWIAKLKAEKAFAVSFDKYNLRPTQQAPIILPQEGKLQARLANFGLIPNWSKDRNIAFKTINARVETIEQKPTYAKPFRTKRALLPAIGYYEWMDVGNEKLPFYHQLEGGKPFVMACIYDENTIAEEKPILSFSIITTQPGAKLGHIHERKPVLLKEERIDDWLNPDNVEIDKLKQILDPIPEEQIDVFRVSKLVNNSRNEGIELIKPII